MYLSERRKARTSPVRPNSYHTQVPSLSLGSQLLASRSRLSNKRYAATHMNTRPPVSRHPYRISASQFAPVREAGGYDKLLKMPSTPGSEEAKALKEVQKQKRAELLQKLQVGGDDAIAPGQP